MADQLLRPNDLDLLRQAGRQIRRVSKDFVAFGGLTQNGTVPVRAISGAGPRRLSSIVVRPERGLGGLSWVDRRPVRVDDYARSSRITHDFDAQILGEGIFSLAVAPIIVRGCVRGLMYVGRRTPEHEWNSALSTLQREVRSLAHEIDIRDRVDERIRLLHATEPDARPISAGLGVVQERLREIASGTTDPRTAHELRTLLADVRPAVAEAILTPRQTDVLTLVALGLTNEEIGSRLGLSTTTVKSYLRDAMARLDARTRHAAVLEARRRNLIG
ncbi:LuxR C-terminal-related transcriptional regulator [Nocardia aurantia]|uniref:HTH-type transcriptional activator RamA n=1 Tax=Nocardia aurantia TaxID=2585199 RepID=A0A7K0E1Z5_9NOCA|nr:LuxR C-terminal-related transcriptional regulator [Nocardia aurantia]MQY31828.1 HTH-type transcriptional activator RamA [Nocardia aurantia]